MPRGSDRKSPDATSQVTSLYRRTHAMDHTVVHFEIPGTEPERAAKFCRELVGWEISRWGGAPGGGEAAEYWMVRIVPTDADGQPIRPGVNGRLMRRMFPGQAPVNYIGVASVDEFVRRAERLGAKVVASERALPGMGGVAQLTDTQGDIFALLQTDAAAARIRRTTG